MLRLPQVFFAFVSNFLTERQRARVRVFRNVPDGLAPKLMTNEVPPGQRRTGKKWPAKDSEST